MEKKYHVQWWLHRPLKVSRWILWYNKAGYTAQDAPSTRLKITGDGRTDGRPAGWTDGRTDGHNLLCDGASKNRLSEKYPKNSKTEYYPNSFLYVQAPTQGEAQ